MRTRRARACKWRAGAHKFARFSSQVGRAAVVGDGGGKLCRQQSRGGEQQHGGGGGGRRPNTSSGRSTASHTSRTHDCRGHRARAASAAGEHTSPHHPPPTSCGCAMETHEPGGVCQGPGRANRADPVARGKGAGGVVEASIGVMAFIWSGDGQEQKSPSCI